MLGKIFLLLLNDTSVIILIEFMRAESDWPDEEGGLMDGLVTVKTLSATWNKVMAFTEFKHLFRLGRYVRYAEKDNKRVSDFMSFDGWMTRLPHDT